METLLLVSLARLRTSPKRRTSVSVPVDVIENFFPIRMDARSLTIACLRSGVIETDSIVYLNSGSIRVFATSVFIVAMD